MSEDASTDLMARLKGLEDEVFRFYDDVGAKYKDNMPKVADLAASTKAHTERVAENVFRIYKIIGQEPSELVCVSALLHDTGRLANEGNDENHHVYSAEMVGGFLGDGYDDESVKAVKELVYGHNDMNETGRLKVTQDSPLELKVLCAADKLDRLGAKGAKRLYDNRIRRGATPEKAKTGSEATMMQSSGFLRYLNISEDYVSYVNSQLAEGLEELKKL